MVWVDFLDSEVWVSDALGLCALSLGCDFLVLVRCCRFWLLLGVADLVVIIWCGSCFDWQGCR